MLEIANIHDRQFSVFLDCKEISEKVAYIAKQINKDFESKNPVFIIVLRGAFMFASDMIKRITIPCEVDFIKLSSYDGMHTSGKINLDFEPKIALKNRHVIVVEDIVDSGFTMSFLLEYLALKLVESTTLVSLLSKPENTKVPIKIDYCGFEIPNLFVVGYGLDYNEQGRNLEHIYQIVE